MMMKSMKKKVLAKTGTGKAHNMSAAQYRQEGLMSRLSGNDERLSTQQLTAVENLDFINDMSPMNKKPGYRGAMKKGDGSSSVKGKGRMSGDGSGTKKKSTKNQDPVVTSTETVIRSDGSRYERERFE